MGFKGMASYWARITLIMVLFCIAAFKTQAQKYRIEAKVNYMCGCSGYELQNIKATIGGQTQIKSSLVANCGTPDNNLIFDGVFTSFVTPTLTIEADVICRSGFSSPCTGTASETKSFTLCGSEFEELVQYNGLKCVSLGNTVVVSFKTTLIDIFSVDAISPTNYCETDQVITNATSDFTGYQWFYKDASLGSFIPISSVGSGNSITFGLTNLSGTNLGLDNPIYVGAKLGPCQFRTSPNPIYFLPKPPIITSADAVPIDAICYGEKGGVMIKGFSRDFVSGERLILSIRPVGSTFVVAQQTDITLSDLPVTFTGIDPGDYEAYVESFIPDPITPGSWQPTGCGLVQYYPFTINEPTAVNFSSSSTNPLCVGGSSGSISVSATGGSNTGYTYSKDNGINYQATNILSGLGAGSYSVKVRDSKGCESVASAVVLSNPPSLTISGAVTSDYGGSDISCATSTNGQITANGSGGTGTLMYSKDGTTFQSSTIFNSLGAGNYAITVKDANGCTQTSSVVPVVAPPAITGTLSSTPTTCNGTATGSITVTSPSGGTGPLEYSKDGSTYQGSTTFNGLAATNYTITIRDENLCTTTLNTTINQPAAIIVTGTPTVVSCAGGSDGQVTISASNGVGALQYAFNSGSFQTSNIFTGVSAGSYTLSVRDGNSCLGTGNVTVSSNPAIAAAITTSTAISCNGGNNGALNLTPSGGVGPYSYSWSTGATTEDIAGLSASTYTIAITDTKSCQKSFTHTLTQPQPITIVENTSDYNGVNVSCFGSSNGTISITPAGGNGGYTYQWSNGSTTKDISTLAAGTYTITTTDSKNCTGTKSITLTQPIQLQSSIGSTQNILCFGGNTGSITLTTSGGTTAYQYSINNGSSWQSSSTFNTLAANSYTILTRDANGCTDSDNTILTSPTALALTVSNLVNTTCNQNNGSATATTTGGAGGYSYTWLDNTSQPIGTANTITNLGAGIYTIQTKDQNNCTKQQVVTISSSNGPSISTTSTTTASCSYTSDGSATISITQGQAPYEITWPDNQSTTTATNLSGGDYVVQVKDASGCLALKTVTVTAPPVLTINTVTEQAPNCAGNTDGSITVSAQGGNGGYSYQWNSGNTTGALMNVGAGTYTVTLKDVKNCEATQTFTLIDPAIFTIDVGGDEKICAGQTITKQVNESDGTYSWTGPDNFTSTSQQVAITTPGMYSVEVMNVKGCKATDTFEVIIDPNLLKADFLLVSEAHVGDTIAAIDISWPLPSSLVWDVVPAEVIEQTADYTLVRYDEVGTYTITIEAQLAQCSSRYSQSIIILEALPSNSGGRKPSGLIRVVNVYPNPAQEQVTVEVGLNRTEQVLLEVYHLQSNERILTKWISGEATYKEDLVLTHLKAGLYVINVKAGDETRTVKLIKL